MGLCGGQIIYAGVKPATVQGVMLPTTSTNAACLWGILRPLCVCEVFVVSWCRKEMMDNIGSRFAERTVSV